MKKHVKSVVITALTLVLMFVGFKLYMTSQALVETTQEASHYHMLHNRQTYMLESIEPATVSKANEKLQSVSDKELAEKYKIYDWKK